MSATLLSPAAPDQTVGWYGKLPSLGDFTSSRLPQSFVTPWDAWLAQSLASSRATLGERWQDAYLSSPVWRFALAAQTCGPTAWAGVLMPSVDRVGRYFPLTVAAPVEPHPGAVSAILSARDWFDAIEAVALATLDTQFVVSTLDAALASLCFPVAAPTNEIASALAQWWRSPRPEGFHACLAQQDALAGIISQSALAALHPTIQGTSLWWSLTADDPRVPLLCFSGLPTPASFAMMLGGGHA